MTDDPKVELVHTALVLQLARAVVPIVPTRDEALPVDGRDADGNPVPAFMNIVKSARPPQVLAEAMGLAGIAAGVAADRTIGGLAHGLMIGEPQYDVNPLVGSPETLACLVPLRAALRGVSLLA